MTNQHETQEVAIHDRGLAFDLSTLMDRRRALGVLAGLGLATLTACKAGGSTSSASSTTTTTTTAGSSGATCDTIPEETAGPYPGDGSNGPNALQQSGVVRSDIRSSFGTASGTASGVPLQIELTILDSSKNCTPYAGAAVYLWHCSMDGKYSMYSQGITSENYLRGVQIADSNGVVRFTSIFPGAYSGRWPHIHFEVYSDVDAAIGGGNKIATSQLALPKDVCTTVYATDGYSQSVRNLAQTSLENDNVFGDDDGVDQLATVTGSVTQGYVAKLDVSV